MKTLARMTALWVVLGLCLPSQAEILVYKLTGKMTLFSQRDGEWEVRR